MPDSLSLQDRYAPENICFGCGPSNPNGLRIKSFAEGEQLVCTWTPEPHHQAFPGSLNGGIIGTLLDCHSNWAAALHLMEARGQDHPPPTVTAEFHVRLLRPTPADRPVHLTARIAEFEDPKVVIEARLESGDRTTATCRGTFVAVGEDHPAARRW